jgi:hypothetical protein
LSRAVKPTRKGRGMADSKLDAERAKKIDTWVREHPEKKVLELKAPIELYGDTKYYDVWKIPISYLIYNIQNGRFAAELMAKEKELGRKLNPKITSDGKIIQTLLLELNKVETAELEESLKENGQLHEGIITYDGAVINANRRMAVLSRLFEKTNDSRFEYLKAARLPQHVDDKDVWKIEAGLQFAKDLRLEYGPVNELLKLREGKNKGLSPKQISHALLGRYKPDDVEKRLRVLDLIDSYLESIGRPKEYQAVGANVEKFNSLSNNVVTPILKKAELPKTEVPNLINIGFSLIKSDKVTHWQIRKLRGIAKNKKARESLKKNLHAQDLKTTKPARVVESFKLAESIYDIDQERDKPKVLVEKAFESLSIVDKRNSIVKEPEVQARLEEILRIVKELLGHP